MPDLFEMDLADDFVLPGDDAALGRLPAAEDEAAPLERPRDEHGRFVSEAAVPDTAPAEEEPAAEPAVEAEAETPPEQTPAEKLYAGNFKSVDELERAYEELRSLNGRQGQELGDLRKAFEDRFAQIDQRLATPQTPQVQITPSLIGENPGYAAQLAFEQQNPAALQVAYEQWKLEDPASAGAWLATKQSEQRLAEIEQRYAAKLAEIEQRVAPAERAAANQEAASLFAPLLAKDPAAVEFANSDAIQQLAQEFPETGQLIASGTPEQQLRGFMTLYGVYRGRQVDNLQVTQQEVARATAEQAQQAREEAFVASASTNSGGPKPSAADQIAAEWDAITGSRDDGWNIR